MPSTQTSEPFESFGPDAGGLTQMLVRWREGDASAAQELFAKTYDRLRRIARSHMRAEAAGHSLEVEGLLHESYLRVLTAQDIDWQNREHFFCVMSGHMRRVLVEHARRRRTIKRGGDLQRIAYHDNRYRRSKDQDESQVEAMHRALARLEAHSGAHAKVLLLNYFGGFTQVELSEILGLSLSTVERRLAFARAWLAANLAGAAQ